MSQVFSQLGNLFGGGDSPISKIVNTGLLGLGQFANYQQQQKFNDIFNLQKSGMGQAINMSPQQLGAAIASSTAPLSNALRQNVGNVVQADMASRGLSQAPGIFASGLAQALAPYQIQQQQIAAQALMSKLGLPFQYGAAGTLNAVHPQPSDLSGLMQKLGQIWSNKPSQPGITDAGSGGLIGGGQIFSGGGIGSDVGPFGQLPPFVNPTFPTSTDSNVF